MSPDFENIVDMPQVGSVPLTKEVQISSIQSNAKDLLDGKVQCASVDTVHHVQNKQGHLEWK